MCFALHRQQLQCTRISEFTVRITMLPRHPKLRSGALAASRRWWLPRCSLLRCAPRVPPAFPLEKYMPRWLNKRVLTILEPHPPCSLAFSPLSGYSPQPLHLRSRPALLCIALRAVSPPCLSAASQPNPSQSRPALPSHRSAPLLLPRPLLSLRILPEYDRSRSSLPG